MKELLRRFLFHIKVRIPAIFVCVLLFCTFGLYYLGLFEISFIKRPEAWKDNSAMLYEAINTLKGKDKEPADTEEIPSDTTASTLEGEETEPGEEETRGPKPDNYDPGGSSDSDKIYPQTILPSKSELEAEGYKVSDGVFDENSKFAVLETDYSLPKKFSFATKTYDKQYVVYHDDGKGSEVMTEQVTENRPAIELYMGYIFFDDVATRYILAPDGTPLSKYNSKYTPAYTRDKEGRPLFYQTYKEKIEYPTELGEPDEEGNAPWLSTAEIEVERKRYYYLDKDGKTFVESDYNDATDNRGLYFDYPAYYGIADEDDTEEGFVRYYKYTTKIVTKTDKNKKITDIFEEVKWLFRALTEEEKESLENDKERPVTEDGEPDYGEFDPDGEDTVYPYSKAYDYSEGYAVVMGDVTWTYVDEDVDLDEDGKDDTVEVTDTELYVVDEEGNIMFESRKNFKSDLGWTANEFYCEPLLRDISSLGSYYFDHGLLRVRLQSYDRYQFTEYDMFMIGTDDDILVRPDGSRFYIPSGYKLEAYSDGMVLLSNQKNGRYGFMNYKGEWVVQADLLSAGPFIEGVAAIQKANGKFGMIDTEGKTVIPFRYDYVSTVSSGVVAAYSEASGWELYTKMAK